MSICMSCGTTHSCKSFKDKLDELESEIRKRDEALNYLKGKVGYHNILCDVSKEPCFTCAIINKTNQILRGEK